MTARPTALACLVAAWIQPLAVRAAMDAASIAVFKAQQDFRQTNAVAPPALQTHGGWRFGVVVAMSGPGSVRSGTVRRPDSTGLPLVSEGTSLVLMTNYDSQAALDAAWPSGPYTVELDTLYDGLRTVTLLLTHDAWPTTPRIANFTAAQAVNPAADFTLAWDPMTGGTAADFIQVEIQNSQGQTVFATPAFGQPGALNGTHSSVVIPGLFLPPGDFCRGRLFFAKAVSTDTNGYPGVPNAAAYAKRTEFPLTTIVPPRGLTLSPSSLTADATNELRLAVTGLATGQTVRAEIFLDFDADGTVDAGEPLLHSFELTDGQAAAVGGVRNLSVPGDEDGAADGLIRSILNLRSEDEVRLRPGTFVVRVRPVGGGFEPLTASLLVTPPSAAQSIVGQVRSGGVPVPFAWVFLIGPSGDAPVATALADANGQFNLPCPTGTWLVGAVRSGYVLDFSSTTPLTVTAGATVTNDVNLTASDRTIAGRLTAEDTGQPLAGVEGIAESEEGLVTLFFTDTNGTFQASVSSAEMDWRLKFSAASAGRLGYVVPRMGWESGILVNLSTGSVSGLEFTWPRATALVYGQVTDTQGQPLPHYPVRASGWSSEVSGHTRADGRYALGVAPGGGMIRAGTVWLDGSWYYGQETSMWAEQGQAGWFDLLASVANTPVAGQVVDDGGVPVANVGLDLYSWGGASLQARSGPDGRFALNLFGGRWTLSLDEDDARARRLIGPPLVFTVLEGEPLTNLLYVVLRANLRITGTLRNSQGLGLSNILVFAWGQAGDTNLGNVRAVTDGAGAFELAVAAGLWNVSVDCSALSAGCLCCPESRSVPVTDTNVTVDLVASNFSVRAELPDAAVGQYLSWLYLGNCWGGSFTWTVVSNGLPPGLTLDPGGYLSGTPGEVGLFTFTVRASNATCVVEGPTRLRVLPPPSPDLVPVSLSAPVSGEVLSSIPITYVVSNSGPAAVAGSWADRIYLSADGQLGPEDQQVGAFNQWSWFIPSGSAYERSGQLALPCVPPGAYFLIIQADALNQIAEQNEANNLLAVPLTVTASQAPDLQPVAIDAPATAQPGESVLVSWIGTNTGAGATASWWADRLYLSSDPLLSTNDVEVCYSWGGCGVTRWGALAPGQGYNQSAWLAVPSVPPGDYFLLLQLDADGASCEPNRTNNLLARPLRVAAPADLEVVAAQAPASAVPAGSIQVIVTVTNHGPATALPAWADAVYLSADANWQPLQDLFLGQFSATDPLPAGAAYTWTQAVQLACVPPGDWHLLFVTDVGNGLIEGNEANNLLALPLAIAQFTDLAPLALTAPAQGAPRELITVSWALTNHGPLTATPPWTDRLYLSPTPTWSESAVQLNNTLCEFCAGFAWSDPLPGQTAATGATVQARIPNVAAGSWYLLLRLNADQELCENSYANNLLAVSFTVLPPADLVAVRLDAPAVADSGQTVQLTWAVTNLSAQTAHPPWTDLLYLSTNGAVLDPTDRLLGWFNWPGSLAPGQGYLGLQTVELPPLPAGTYHLILWVDGYEQLLETNEANNQLVQPIQILNADLTPTAVQIASTVAALRHTPVAWTVLNAGPGAAQPWWYDQLLLGTNGAPPGQAQVLGTFWIGDPLPPSQSYTQSQTLYLPALPSGAYQLTLHADAGDYVTETTETNNTLTVPLTVANPDLAVTLLGGLNPRWAVSATASSEAGPGFDANAAVGPPDALYCVGSTGGWMPAGTGTNLEWLQVDFGTPATARGLVVRETYQPGFIQQVDLIDTNGTPHTVWTGADPTPCMEWFTLWFEPTVYPVQGARIWTSINGREQIDAVGLVADPPGPIAGVSQQEVLLLWQVTNLGPGPVPGGWWDRFYFSADATWSTNDALVLARYQSGPLPVGRSALQVASLRLPQMDQGSYWLIARTDDAAAYYEDDEANNLAPVAVSLAAPADLAVTSLSAPATGCTEAGVTVAWTVANVGSNATQLSWTDRVYLSADAAWDAGDLLLRSVSVTQPLVPGASYTNSVTVTLPGVPAGVWYVLVKADADGALYEASESNNLQATPLTLSNPDLVPIALEVPTTLQSTQRFQPLFISWTVANVGGCAAEPTWSDLVYLSTDPEWDPQDRFLVSFWRATVVPAHGSYQVTNTAWLPEGTVGRFYLLLRSDHYDQLYESSEANNFTNRPIEIVLAPVPDLAVTNIAAPPEAVSGQDILVSWVLTNLSSADAFGPWRDVVYLASSPGDPNPRQVGDFVFTGVVPGYGSVVRAQRVTVPAEFSGPRWVVVETDAGRQLYERDGESNNVSVALEPVQVRLRPYPNLRVSFVNAPPTAWSGQQAVIQWGVTNAGTGGTTVPTWYDRVWLSADPVFDPNSDSPLSPEAANPSYLDAGDGYVNFVSVTLPRGLDGPHYFFVQTDAYNWVNEHTNEHDNVLLGGPTQISLTPPPDLQVLSVSAPVQALSGQGMPVTFTVTNAGAGRTEESRWWDGLYISRTNELDASSVWLGRVRRDGALEAGASYTVSNFVVTLPVAYTGACWILVMADMYSAVYEHVFEQNNVGATPRTTEVRLTPPPDLEVTLVDAPATALAGRSLTVRYRVANYGSTPTPNSFWEDRLYLSADAQFDPGQDTRLATAHRWGGLEVGQEYENSFTVTLANTLVGTYYLFVHADAANVVFELDNTNNIAFAPTPVQVLFAPPDLVATNLVAPATANAGGAFLVSWTVRNVGPGDSAQSRWIDRVVLSADTTLGNADDRALLDLTHDGLLAPGASYTVSNQLVPLPVNVTAGAWYLFVRTDAANQVFEGTNDHNNATAPWPITVTRQTADLALREVTAPASAQTQETIPVSWVVENLGAVPPNATYWQDTVYLSADPVLDAGDRWLASFQSLIPLAPGAAYTNLQSVRLPADAAGDWYVLVLADANEAVVEPGARDNNLRAATNRLSVTLRPVADLVVTNVDGPTEAWAGQSLTVSWTVRNQGNAPAPENFYDSVYLSPDQFLDRGTDLYLGYAYRPFTLTNGSEYTQTRSFSLPPGLSGLYYVIVVTDAGNAVYERDGEGNNTGFDPVAVQVRLLPPADLVVGTITIPANALPGRPVEVTYTVHNQGANAARGSWLDALYVSADTRWDLGDALLGRRWFSGEVPAGSNYTATVTGPLPGVMPGQYHVLLRSDILNHLAESNETNNLGASLERMVVDAEDLPLGQVRTNSLAAGQAAWYRFTATNGQTLRIRLDAANDNSANELYVRFGQMPSRNQFDAAAQEPFVSDPELVLPITQSGTYYLMVYAAGAPTAFSVRTDLLPFSVTVVTPNRAGNRGEVTVRIAGALFTSNTVFQMIPPAGPALSAVSARVLNSALAVATFNFAGAPLGRWTLRAWLPGEPPVWADLTNALFIQEGVGPRVEVVFDGDLAIRPNRISTFRLLYANTGDADTAAPLLLAWSAAGRPVGLTSADLRTNTLHLLGLNSALPYTTLPPGTLHGIMLHVLTAAGGSRVDMRARAVLADDPMPITEAEWLDIEAAVRPAALTEAQWTLFWANLRPRIGSTWGDYVQFLNRLAADLAERGMVERDVRAMMAAIYVEDPNYRASSVLAGQALDTNGVPRVNLELAAYRLSGGRHVLGGMATTDANGRFTLRFLPPGDYVFALLEGGFDQDRDGLVDAQPPRVTLTAQADLTNLTLYVVGPAPFTPPPENEDSPVLTLDSSGTPHLLWCRGGLVWHAWFDGTNWVQARAVSEAHANSLALAAAPNLLDGTDAGLIAVWEQGADNDSELFYAVARPLAGGGWQWSRPVRLTSDAVRDAAPALGVNGLGQALVVWLKRNAAIQDDTDLYFALVNVASGALEWSGSARELASAADGGSLHFGYIKTWGPYYAFGTRFETGVDIGIDGGVSGCSAAVSGNAKGMMSFSLPGFRGFDFEGSGAISANWEAHQRRCEWQFKGAQLDAAVQGAFNWKDGLASCLNGLGPPGVAAAKGIHLAIAAIHRWTPLRVNQGVQFTVGLEMADLRWTRVPPFPGWVGPDHIGSMDLVIGAGPYAKLSQESVSDVEFALSGAIRGKIGILPSFTPKELFGNIQLAARIRSFSFNRNWNITLAGGEGEMASAADGELPGGLVMTYDPAAALGTGNVYGTNALRADVASDLYRDAPPVLLRHADGRLAAVWSREEDPAGTNDCRLYVAEFNAGTWTAPAVIPGSGGLHSALGAVVDGADQRLVVWAQADGSSLGPTTTFEELQAVRDSADLFWTVYADGSWSTPARLTSTAGPDADVALTRLSSGEVLLSWTWRDANGLVHLLSARWNGLAWSAVTELASGDLATPRPTELGGAPAVFWSEDSEPDPEVERGGLRFRRFLSGAWQPAQDFEPILAEAPAPLPALRDRTRLASSFLPPVPDSCCECKKMRHLTSGSGDCVRGTDFDEATCTHITFYEPCVPPPVDPNDILGPEGFGEARWVPATATLAYTIRFENRTNAAAPAQEVIITHPLDPDLDWRTFRLGTFGLGTLVVPVPTNRAFYSTRLDLIESRGFYVDVVAGIDVATGEAYWRFTTIDPATGETPTDPRRGFLPPNTNAPAGEGFVTYTIRARASSTTGARVDAQATIVFDTEEPIDTPPIFNTLDAGRPTSEVLPLPSLVSDPIFLVVWTGADEVGGSALASFDIYVSEDGRPYRLWLGQTTLNAAPFTGAAGHTYAFYSVARDNAGNVEDAPRVPDAVVTVAGANQPPTLTVPGTLTVLEGETLVATNSATDPDLPPQTLTFSLGPEAPAGASLDPTNGVFSWTPGEADGPGTFTIPVIVTDNGTPSLSITQSFTVIVLESNSPPSLAPLPDVTMFEETTLAIQVFATDPDLPPQRLTFSLGPQTPVDAVIHPTTGWLTWTPAEDEGPGLVTFTVWVTDDGEPPLAASRQFTVTVLETNSAPRLAPVPDQIAYVLTPLVVTNTATDSDPRGDTLTFGLGPDRPAGSWVHPTNGLFVWRPSRHQAPSTNLVSVWVMDDGFEPRATTNTFTVIVTDYLEVELGEALVQAGQTASVPVRVTSTAPVQALDFELFAPSVHLSQPALADLAPVIATNRLDPLGTDWWRVHLGAAPGSALLGTQAVARLEVVTASDHSAFVPLLLSHVTALQTNGTAMPHTLATPGRVVMVAEQPLLEALVTTNGQRVLRLYGLPAPSFVLEQATDVTGPWQPVATNLTITNLVRGLANLPATNVTLFYRLRQE